ETPQSNPAVRRQIAASFQPGDLVRLRSGGPLMTVDNTTGDQVDCLWSGYDGQPYAESFPVEVLQKF
ncbi:MAG: DUF2158 domain-containing protein, partial [Bradyrhizobium sp.]